MLYNEMIANLQSIIENPYDYCTRHPEYRYIGYNCLFIPHEIIHAAGFIPVRLYGRSAVSGEEYIPSQSCEFVKNILTSFSSGFFDFLKGCVFSYCCDTLHTCTSVIDENRFSKLIFISLPIKFEGDLVRRFLKKEIEAFIHKMEVEYHISDVSGRLEKSVTLYSRNRELISLLKQTYQKYYQYIPFSEFLTVYIAGQFLPVDEHNRIIEDLIGMLTDEFVFDSLARKNMKKVILSGSVNGEIKIVRSLENMGVAIIDDDLCEGTRYLDMSVPKDTPPVDIVVNRILSRYCPVKIKSSEKYIDILLKRYNVAKADGIVFSYFSFCDPQFIELSSIQGKIDELGIPTIMIQNTIEGDVSGQVETRVEAFVEII
jgi:benzoyl-CoA reductase/2-hydroxyglutaryl-CoA dehydratase subunit BcrC/BadD/HgdB